MLLWNEIIYKIPLNEFENNIQLKFIKFLLSKNKEFIKEELNVDLGKVVETSNFLLIEYLICESFISVNEVYYGTPCWFMVIKALYSSQNYIDRVSKICKSKRCRR